MSTHSEVRRPGFLQNVFWNWFGISASLLSAFWLSPFVVRTLGDDNYGLWAVTVALVEYYWLLDFGLRSATVRFTAHHHATGDMDKVNQTLSVGVVYNICLLPLLVGGTFLLRESIARWFNVSNPLFPSLLLVVVTAWALTSLFSTFTSCLEGLQRFDVVNQTGFLCTVIRAVGTFLLLLTGHNVLAMGYMTAGSQVLMHVLNYFRLRQILPALHISLTQARMSQLKEMLRYGSHSVFSSMGQRILSQSPPLLIAYFLPERYAGYYTNPRQLLDYTVEAVARIGNVSNSRAAELVAMGQLEKLEKFSISVNRLSLAVFLPLSIFLAVYGHSFLLVWIKKPDFAQQASSVLLALLAGHTLANAGQFSSGSILFGIRKHQRYARTLVVEAALSVAGMCFLIPAYGIASAAAWNSLLMVLNRALITPWLLTQELKANYWSFLAGVNRPLLAAPPVAVALVLLRFVIPGTNWAQLFLAGGVTMLVYLPTVYFLIPREDRQQILDHVGAYPQKIRPAN
jgi:O-antigen/teichoic acid export membrane protein